MGEKVRSYYTVSACFQSVSKSSSLNPAAILEDLSVLATSPSSNSSAQPLEIVVSKAEQGKKR